MTLDDIAYVEKVLAAGLIQSPCLECGVGYKGENSKTLIQQAGLTYFGTDMVAGKDVDFVAHLEDPTEVVEKCFERVGKFGSVLLLNVLEHTFNPFQVLDNVFAVLRPGGTCILVTPVVWPLHSYPSDYWRINPDFYEEYCKRKSFHLLMDYFEYVGRHHVRSNRSSSEGCVLPCPSLNPTKFFYSRVIHKLFNTCGRGMFFPSTVAIGAVIRK